MEKKTELIDLNGKKFNIHYGVSITLGINCEVTKFFPDTSGVSDKFITVEFSHNDDIDKFWDNLIFFAVRREVKAYKDNKTVFELESNGKKLYVGFYDGKMSIGLSCYTR